MRRLLPLLLVPVFVLAAEEKTRSYQAGCGPSDANREGSWPEVQKACRRQHDPASQGRPGWGKRRR
jgi:hypothetical protein